MFSVVAETCLSSLIQSHDLSRSIKIGARNSARRLEHPATVPLNSYFLCHFGDSSAPEYQKQCRGISGIVQEGIVVLRTMSLPNVWHLRRVADSSAKACYICYKPSTSVLITPDNKVRVPYISVHRINLSGVLSRAGFSDLCRISSMFVLHI